MTTIRLDTEFFMLSHENRRWTGGFECRHNLMRNLTEWHEEPYVHGAGGLVADNLEQWPQNIGIPSYLARTSLFYTWLWTPLILQPFYFEAVETANWVNSSPTFFHAAFKLGRREHFTHRLKMLKSPIARLPAILLDLINRPTWEADCIYEAKKKTLLEPVPLQVNSSKSATKNLTN